MPNEYYVYVAYVNSVPKYVGKGKGTRFKHVYSGRSSCKELNEAYFQGKTIEVIKAFKGLSESEALDYESQILSELSEKLFNKSKGNTSSIVSYPSLNEKETSEECAKKWIAQFDSLLANDKLNCPMVLGRLAVSSPKKINSAGEWVVDRFIQLELGGNMAWFSAMDKLLIYLNQKKGHTISRRFSIKIESQIMAKLS